MSKEVFDQIADGLNEALSVARLDLIAEAITAHWGERCPDFDEDCWCCRAWAQYDGARRALEERRPVEIGESGDT